MSTVEVEMSTVEMEMSTVEMEMSTVEVEMSTAEMEMSTVEVELSTAVLKCTTAKYLWLGLGARVSQMSPHFSRSHRKLATVWESQIDLAQDVVRFSRTTREVSTTIPC